MKIIHFMIIFLHLSVVSCLSIEKPIEDGLYIGLEKMTSLTPEDKETHWYHENRLKIKKAEVTLEKVPITIRKGEKLYSASDGGFFYYKGSLFQKYGKQFVYLSLVSSDYVRLTKKSKKNSEYQVVVNSDGSLKIDNVTYKKSNYKGRAKGTRAKRAKGT